MDNPVTHREHEEFRRLMESENERLKEENDRQNHTSLSWRAASRKSKS